MLDPGALAIMVLLMLLVNVPLTYLALASSWEVVDVLFVVRPRFIVANRDC